MRKGFSKWVLLGLFLVLAWGGLNAKEFSTNNSDKTVALALLPHQELETYRLIFQGGPFPYAKDGTVFGNRERLLPSHPRGYYREYTVKPLYSKNRGVRRIVCGGPITTPDVCYYTADHYASFRKIVP